MTDFLQRKNTKGWSTLTKSQRRWLIVSRAWQMQVPLSLASRREGSIGVRDTSSGGLPIIRTSRSSWLLTYRNGIHTRPNAVSHPSTNWAWRSVTTRLWRRTRRLGEQLVPMTALTPTTTSHDGDEPAAVAADCCEVGLCLVAPRDAGDALVYDGHQRFCSSCAAWVHTQDVNCTVCQSTSSTVTVKSVSARHSQGK